MAGTWDPVAVKAQLRLAAQRLGQLQDRKDSLAQITRRDIATLLHNRNVTLARAKAENLMKEDAASDILQVLEMYCGVIIEQFSELEKHELNLNPPIVEAASSIIYAAPHTESKDLSIAREMLIQRLGPDFTLSAVNNTDRHVAPRLLRAMSPVSSAAAVDESLLRISRSFKIDWKPEMRPHEKLNILSDLLDTSNGLMVVDISKLRYIASSGIPDHPPWLRPRIWKLLLGILPPAKPQWEAESQKQRADYYDLIRRLLTPVAHQPPCTIPLSPKDRSLSDLFKTLTRVPPALFSGLEEEPELSHIGPLSETAPVDTKIMCADSLDHRLTLIEERTAKKEVSLGTPEIRLELDPDTVSTNIPGQHQSDNPEQRHPGSPTTLHPSSVYQAGVAHPKHISALLRLLFVHSSLHPTDQSPHIASLLVPLYCVLHQEIEQSELAHAEADTFWVFEALVGEIAELEEEEGGNLWMRKFGERLRWADEELFADLHVKGLDPALPHYSYRWLAPLLTHTLPISSVLVVWDSIFSQPGRLRMSNAKLDFLLDICTGMLIRTRARLMRLGKAGNRSPSLWDGESSPVLPSSPIRPWELGDAFMEGMTLLQAYPIQEAGGIEGILQVATDLANRREEQFNKAPKVEALTLGAKLRNTVWRGITNQAPSPDDSPVDETEHEEEEDTEEGSTDDAHDDDGDETETSGLASRLRNTVWRGITNQISMEAPPSPSTSLSPIPSPRPSPKREMSPSPQPSPSSIASPTSIWSYAEKVKESNVAAQLSKVSSSWTMKAIGAWNAKSKVNADAAPTPTPNSPLPQAALARFSSPGLISVKREDEGRRGSMPNMDRPYSHSPPTRPAYFRPPRDSWMLQPQKGPLLSAPTSPESPASLSLSDNAISTPKTLSVSLAPWTNLQAPIPKPTQRSGPKPLLLNSSSLMTKTPSNTFTRSATNTPTPQPGQWTDVLRSRVQPQRRHEQQSSVSSVSTTSSRPARRADNRLSGWESDTSVSRVVPLHRGAVSPMAPAFQTSRGRQSSQSSSFSDRGGFSPTSPQTLPHAIRRKDSDGGSSTRGWGRVDVPDSPTTLPSSPPPRTPVTANTFGNGAVRVSHPERQWGSVVLSETGVLPLEAPTQSKKVPRKGSPTPTVVQPEYTSGSESPTKTPLRIRTKRHAQRPPNLQVRDREGDGRSGTVVEQQMPSPSSLVAPDPVDADMATTPKAADFPCMSPQSPSEQRSPRRLQKISTEGHEPRTRKVSKDGQVVRPRKVSNEGYHRRTESAAEEGDDEGYDDLLSAYESEEGSTLSVE